MEATKSAYSSDDQLWTGPWLDWTLAQLDIERAGFTDVLPIVAISLDVTGARATTVGLRVAPSRLVSPARC